MENIREFRYMVADKVLLVEGKNPEVWRKSCVILIFEGKAYVQEYGN